FSGQLYEQLQYPLTVLKEGPLQPSVLAGPTCDSIDIVAESIDLPELEIGDVIIGRMMGAYTAATASEFNSIPRTQIVALDAPEPQQQVAYIA
ncbi:MAG: type III PLP-dependent enzyme, partial [Candidatus Competibacteraceae bacterium]|nr:type III PLP-dependent enzyme [Candidatus Competibacteraceae bacterium]